MSRPGALNRRADHLFVHEPSQGLAPPGALPGLDPFRQGGHCVEVAVVARPSENPQPPGWVGGRRFE
jgi:hypothetical protein